MNLLCKDPIQYTYFSSRSQTKIDYFLFDRYIEDWFLKSDFPEDEIIGTDHIPGYAEMVFPKVISPPIN